MKEFKNILSIRGEGQNVGKTLLATAIIAKFYRRHKLVALKITPHQHKNTGNTSLIFSEGNTVLLEEKDILSAKDTGRMLASGAERVFLLQCTDNNLERAIEGFFKHIDKDSLVVCESGKLADIFKTGINLYLRRLNCQVCNIEKKLLHTSFDRLVNFDGKGFDLALESIQIKNNTWILNEN